ncbi:MAG: RHS repeat-associated core domain-containing protein [Terriglobales bacterium]
MPFGDDLSCSASDASRLHLTGQEQDAETTGLAAFPFRYYSETQGHWLSPDPAGFATVNPANPQSWSPYAYIDGDPVAPPCR